MLITASEIIKQTLKTYKENFKTFSKYLINLAITGIVFLISFVLLIFYIGIDGLGILSALSLLITLALLVLTILSFITLVKILNKNYTKEKTNRFLEEMKINLHLIFPIFIVYLLFNFIISLCLAPAIIINFIPSAPVWLFILSIILGLGLIIFIEILFKFSYFAVVIDEHKIIQSFKTSLHLVKNRWWATFWRWLAPSLLFIIALSIIQFIINIPADIITNNFAANSASYIILSLIISIIAGLINLFFIPLTILPSIILYEELKKTPDIKTEKKSKDEVPAELPKL